MVNILCKISPLMRWGFLFSIYLSNMKIQNDAILWFRRRINDPEIMDVLEGPVEISDCLTNDVCDYLEACATRVLWRKIRDSINTVMAGVTLQDMLNDYKGMQATPIKEGIFIHD